MRALIEGCRGIWASCGHAWRGIVFAVRSQRNIRVHLAVAVIAITAAVLLRFNRIEMILTILTVSLVILGELLNTALEVAMNLVEARDHPVVKACKDVAAGGVLLAVAGAIAVGLLLFGPHLLLWLRGIPS